MLSEFEDRSVLTVRPRSEGGEFRGSEPERVSLIRALSVLKLAALDVELRTLDRNPGLATEFRARATIVSWHDPAVTPSRTRLRSIMRRAARSGTPKLVTKANSPLDNLEILSLYQVPGPSPIAFCMGGQGAFSRAMSMELGAPVTYASLPGEPTASGQFTLAQAVALRRSLGDA